MKTARLISALCAVGLCLMTMPFGALKASSDVPSVSTGVHELIIDSKTINRNKNSEWQGFGCVSASGSSRLLLDYKYEEPDEYHRILELLFAPDGPVRMTHFKIEMGADINSSGGTEPSVKRSAEESPNVRRGAGFQIAADIREINPDVTFELIAWGAPGYIRNAEPEKRNELKYQWFRQTIDRAYEEFGIVFDSVSPNFNEKEVDAEFIKYFSESLKSEKDTPYDYSKIKIVASDEDASYSTAAMMLADSELMKAVDVIGIHYTSTSDENTLKCKNVYGKTLRYSEGIAPANVARLSVNADGSGLGGANSTLDVAGRIVNMFPNGGFTLYEFQPAVAAYYNGAAYFPKQLITANEPWSGYTETGSGVYMCEHFSLFTEKGWQFVESGCYGDGSESGHVLYDTTNNYITLTDPDTGDYSTILVNNTDSARDYSFTVRGLEKAGSEVQVWETRGPDEGERYDAHYMKNVMDIEPDKDGSGAYTYRLTVKPYSMVTVSTLSVTAPQPEGTKEQTRLELPYTDDFEYERYGNYTEERSGAPRYTTDIGGAFEVYDDKEKGMVLRQMMTRDMRGIEWDSTPEPVTTLGDDTWSNYQVKAKVRLGDTDGAEDYDPAKNYAGIGLRYINSSAKDGVSGCRILITASGEWQLCRQQAILARGNITDFDPNAWHELSITASADSVSATVDGTQVANEKIEKDFVFSGRAALYSAYYNSCFDDLEIMPVEQLTGYVTRLDDLEDNVYYKGSWSHNTMDSYTCHNRTSSSCAPKSDEPDHPSFEFAFEGDSVALIGKAKGAVADIEIDGETVAKGAELNGNVNKSALWHRYSLGYSQHSVKVTVTSGSLSLDAVEYGTMARLKNGDPKGGLIENDEGMNKNKAKKTGKVTTSGFFIVGGTVTLIAAVLLVGGNIRGQRRKRR